MQTANSDEVLFPEEIIPVEGVLGIIVALRHPHRVNAKGIDCITGFSVMVEQEGSAKFWLPVEPQPKHWTSLDDTLNALPTLIYPLTAKIIHEFLDDYILRNWDSNSTPTFLSSQTLLWDIEQREIIYELEVKELSKLFLSRKVELIDQSRYILDEKTQGHLLDHAGSVFFAREEAVRYLQRKGYLEKALKLCISWHEIVREPDLLDSDVQNNEKYFGYPKILQDEGVERYRNWLRVQRSSIQQGGDCELSSSKVGESLSTSPLELSVAQYTSNAQDMLVPDASSVYSDAIDLTVSQRPIKPNPSAAQLVHTIVADSDKDAVSSSQSERLDLKKSKEEETTLIGTDVVCNLTGYQRSTIYQYENSKSKQFDATFPKSQILNGVKKWYKSEIDDWITRNMKHKTSS